jgi:hypothetical protein
MEVLTIQSEAFQQLFNRLDKMESYFKNVAHLQPLSEQWFDGAQTCKILKISKRTLQNYRYTGVITYTKFGGKIYFSSNAIEEHLRTHTRKAFKKFDKKI